MHTAANKRDLTEKFQFRTENLEKDTEPHLGRNKEKKNKTSKILAHIHRDADVCLKLFKL